MDDAAPAGKAKALKGKAKAPRDRRVQREQRAQKDARELKGPKERKAQRPPRRLSRRMGETNR